MPLNPVTRVKILLPKLERIVSVGREIPKWKDPNSIYFRLPEHYKARQREFLNTVPKPVHYRDVPAEFTCDHEHGVVNRHRETPIPLLYPTVAKMGLWGGEGVIPGYIRPEQTGYKRPQYLSTKLWRPRVMKLIFYSEILDRHYSLTCTRRTLELIEEAKGFDHYILKTPEADMKSDIGMQLKREMLVALAKKETDLFPEDKQKQATIYNRYSKYVLPLEEAEWVGLKPWEAMTKQKNIEAKQLKESLRPLKDVFREELFKKLESGEEPTELAIEQKEKKGMIKRLYEENFKK